MKVVRWCWGLVQSVLSAWGVGLEVCEVLGLGVSEVMSAGHASQAKHRLEHLQQPVDQSRSCCNYAGWHAGLQTWLVRFVRWSP